MPRHPFVLDARSPSVIVPLTGRDLPALEKQIAALRGTPVDSPADSPVDIVEWRVDLFEPDNVSVVGGTVADALRRVTALLPDLPVLVTVRTSAEGGSAEVDDDEYLELITEIAATGLADAVDVEYRRPRAAEAVAAVHAHGTPVVASNHDFESTPEADEIVARLADMERMGADVAKIAVMPRSASDVVTLLAATERRHRESAVPLITMSMGALGGVTRIGGGVFGSAATFATVGAASAPGQLPAAGVRAALDLLAP